MNGLTNVNGSGNDSFAAGAASQGEGTVLITGGAGFVGVNVAHRLLSAGRRVLVFDNLSRPGVERNLQWLQDTHGTALEVEITDVCDQSAVREAVRRVDQVFHFAAQVAVTTSIADPMRDFEVNARGTLHVLEAMRELQNEGAPVPSLVFTSTNKVYGALEDVPVRLNAKRHEPICDEIRCNGIGEARPLDFHSPYGCSKGAADQYVLDYARTFNLPAVVFRMSCIYGPHQFGTEDQGWVAHFLIRALSGEPVTIYGDGYQVRDILFVEDLVDALMLAQRHMSTLSGTAFNIGGGPRNTVSLAELLSQIGDLTGEEVSMSYDDWRAGDQHYYVSDTRRFGLATGWSPSVDIGDGVQRLHAWLRDNASPVSATSDWDSAVAQS